MQVRYKFASYTHRIGEILLKFKKVKNLKPYLFGNELRFSYNKKGLCFYTQ